MKKSVLLAVVGMMLAGSTCFATDTETGLPAGLKGLRGVLYGTLVSKTEKSFVVKVEKVLNVWKESTATDPQAAVG